MVQRLTYRKRHSYATKSNQHRVVKTPGNNSSIVNSVKEKRRSKFIGLIVVFVYEMKVGNWCTRPPRKELVDLSVLSLERGFKGYFCFSFFLFSNFSFGLYFCFDFIKKLWKYFMIDMIGWRRFKLFLLEVGILFCYSESNRIESNHVEVQLHRSDWRVKMIVGMGAQITLIRGFLRVLGDREGIFWLVDWLLPEIWGFGLQWFVLVQVLQMNFAISL